MPVTVHLRDGSRVQAERVQRDGRALRALVVDYENVVDDARREAYRQPVGLTWRTWPARSVKCVRVGGRDDG